MCSRLIAVSGWFVAVVVLLISGIAWAAPQAVFPEGSFVTGRDGSRWAVGGGARVRLTFATDDTNALEGLRDAGTAATLGEASAALAGAAPPAAMTAPANPAETLLGQRITACAEAGLPFEVEVVEVDWQRTVTGRTAAGNSMFVVLVADLTNTTGVELGPYRGVSPAFRLIDEQDRSFDGDLNRHFDLHEALARERGLSAPFHSAIRPGITERRALVFEVAPNVQRLTLQSRASC
jgi:hypothetical protein